MADRSPARLERAQSSLRPLRRPCPTDRDQRVAVPEGFRNPLAPAVSDAPPALLPLIRIEDDISPHLDRALRPVAMRAQNGDWSARDALYMAFEPKLMRFARRIRVPFAPEGAHGLWERGDVVQEAYLVFLGVIESWSPEIPFGRYVLANFPWRLRDAVHRGIGKRTVPPRMFGVPIESSELIADGSTARQEQGVMLKALAASLGTPLDEVFRLHVIDGLTLTETAGRIGVSRRTVTRYWHDIVLELRRELTAPER